MCQSATRQEPVHRCVGRADVLTPNSARPSADTVLTTKLDMVSSKFCRLSYFLSLLFGHLMMKIKMSKEFWRIFRH